MHPAHTLKFIFIVLLIYLTGAANAQPGTDKPHLTNGSDFGIIQMELDDFTNANTLTPGTYGTESGKLIITLLQIPDCLKINTYIS